MFIPFIIWFILFLCCFSSALINATAVSSRFLICKARLVLLFEKLNARSIYICSCVYSRMSGLPGKLAARWRLFPQALDTFPCTTTRHTHYIHPHVRGLTRECCATLSIWKTNHPSFLHSLTLFVARSLSHHGNGTPNFWPKSISKHQQQRRQLQTQSLPQKFVVVVVISAQWCKCCKNGSDFIVVHFIVI